MSHIKNCNQEVFNNGTSLLAIDGWAKDIEPWVQKVAKKSGQMVDWHYSCGIAHVLVLGDHDIAMKTANEIESELTWIEPDDNWYRQHSMIPGNAEHYNPTIIRRYLNHEDGLYRNRSS